MPFIEKALITVSYGISGTFKWEVTVRNDGEVKNGVERNEGTLPGELAHVEAGPLSARDNNVINHTRVKLEEYAVNCTELDHKRTWKDVLIAASVKKD